MVPWSDEPYPPFSPEGQQRLEAAVIRFSRIVAEEARAEARAGHANSVSEDHVDLAMDELLKPEPERQPESEQRRRGVTVLLVPSLLTVAGAAVVTALTDWRWANLGVAAFLIVVVIILVRDGRG